MKTEERILDCAVKVFSLRGYRNTAVKEIAKRAEVNSLTIFRKFHDKETLFFSAVEQMKKNSFDDEKLNKKLSYRDVEADLIAMENAYMDNIYASLPLIRIYIGDGLTFDQLDKERWFTSPALCEHFNSYVQTLESSCPFAKRNATLLAEMFVSYIIRIVMPGNKYNNIWESSEESRQNFSEKVARQITFMAEIITGTTKHPIP